jgi:type IV fimbrial biogenesis protein FimT
VSTDQLTCADSANWSDGWVMFADVDGDNALDDDGEAILQVGNPQRGLRAQGNGQGARLISFNATGQPLQASTIGVCGSASAHTGRAIVISVAGRIRHDHAECEAPMAPSDPDEG